jgi:hypothetical protein
MGEQTRRPSSDVQNFENEGLTDRDPVLRLNFASCSNLGIPQLVVRKREAWPPRVFSCQRFIGCLLLD